MTSPRHKWPVFTPADKKIPLPLWNDLLRTVEGRDQHPPVVGYSSREVQAPAQPQPGHIRLVSIKDAEVSARASNYQDFPASIQSLRTAASEWDDISPTEDRRTLLADENQKVALLTDQRVPAFYNAQVGAYVPIVEMRVRFELTENLSFGGNATAYRLEYTGSVYEANSAISFEVYDPFSKWYQNHTPDGQDGARGMASYFSDSDHWEIAWLQHQARMIRFTVDEAGGFDTNDASFGVEDAAYYDGYEPTGGVTTVYNPGLGAPYFFSGADGAEGYAFYDPAADRYTAIQIECP